MERRCLSSCSYWVMDGLEGILRRKSILNYRRKGAEGMEIVITRIGMEVLLDLVDMNKRGKGGGADGEVRDEVDIAIVIKIGVDT